MGVDAGAVDAARTEVMTRRRAEFELIAGGVITRDKEAEERKDEANQLITLVEGGRQIRAQLTTSFDESLPSQLCNISICEQRRKKERCTA